jgi:Flp pilus assembly protein TadG
MALDSLKRLRDDTDGAAFLEFTVFAMFFFTFLFGIVEFSLSYYQWNAGTKAVQLGARLAAVSSPVATELAVANWDLADYEPGDIVAIDDGFTIVCSGATAECNDDPAAYDADAMNTLVYGRGNSSCAEATSPNFGMCRLFTRVKPENVVVTYTYTGLGYAGRPGGPVPTIRVELVDLKMQFFFFDALFGLNDYDIPGLASTVTGEDLSIAGS